MRSNNLSLSIFLDAQSYQSEDDLYDYYDDFENEEDEEEDSEEDSEVSFLLLSKINKKLTKMNSISKNRRMRSQIMKIITTLCMIETPDSIKDSPLLKFLQFFDFEFQLFRTPYL